MPQVLDFALWSGVALFVLIIASVIIRLITGKIMIAGLCDGMTPNGFRFVSAARVQLLIMTLATAANCLSQVWNTPQELPNLSSTWLALFGASQTVYLGSKWWICQSRRQFRK